MFVTLSIELDASSTRARMRHGVIETDATHQLLVPWRMQLDHVVYLWHNSDVCVLIPFVMFKYCSCRVDVWQM